jgi:insertion element IS1 protein InsB
MNEITCPKCERSRYVVKAGSNRGGSQRLRCQSCQIYFTPHPKPLGYDPEIREQALRLYLEGNSLRSIGRILHVHHQSVANWVNAAEKQLPQRVADQTPTGSVEVDELFTFIGKKTKEHM